MLLPGTDYSYWGREWSGDLGMGTGEINPDFSNTGAVVRLLSFHMNWEQARCLPDYCSVKIRQDGVCLDRSLFVFIGVLDAHLNSSNLKNNGYVKAFQQMPTTQIIIIGVTGGKEMRGRRNRGNLHPPPAAAAWVCIVQPSNRQGKGEGGCFPQYKCMQLSSEWKWGTCGCTQTFRCPQTLN